MNTSLHKAFITLGLEPGASKEEVIEAYKLLASGLHPDKHKGKKKQQAEEKLKQINNARELLIDHFKSSHTDSPNCECKSTVQEESPKSTDSKTSTKQSRTEKAKQRNKEREEESTKNSNDSAYEEPKEDEADAGFFADEFTHSYDLQKAKEKAALLWKISLGCLVFYLGCFVYGNMTRDAYSTKGLKGEKISQKEGQVYLDWAKYQQEKIDLVYKITGTKVTKKSAGHWQPPFETKYEKLLASVSSHKRNKEEYEISPHYADSTNPNPGSFDRKTGTVIDQLNRNIVRYQGEMDKWKRKVDFYDDSLKLGAVGGNLQTKRDQAYSDYITARNKRDNARRQLNNLTKKPPTIKDLSNPFYYSKDKNPWGSGTKPPNTKAPGSNFNSDKTIPAIEEQDKKPSPLFQENWSDSKNTWDFNKYRNQSDSKKNYKFRVGN